MNNYQYNTQIRNSSRDYFGGASPHYLAQAPLPIRTNTSTVQFRRANVGMFSDPKPSYQRYSASPAAMGVITKTGA